MSTCQQGMRRARVAIGLDKIGYQSMGTAGNVGVFLGRVGAHVASGELPRWVPFDRILKSPVMLATVHGSQVSVSGDYEILYCGIRRQRTRPERIVICN